MKKPVFLYALAFGLALATTYAGFSTFAYLKARNTQLSDCELARIWYDISGSSTKNISSFTEFLEDVIRIGNKFSYGRLLSKTSYSVAIRYPASDRIKMYVFFISRAGTPTSLQSMSISGADWGEYRKITCNSTGGNI